MTTAVATRTLVALMSVALTACAGHTSAIQEQPVAGAGSVADQADSNDSAPLEIFLEDFGFGASDNHKDFLTYGVVFANPNPTIWAATGVEVELTWLDDAGSVVGRETRRIFVIPPGQRAAAAGRTFAVDGALAASLQVQFRTSEWVDIGAGPYGALEVDGVTLRQDSVTGQVRSSFSSDLVRLDAIAILRDIDGRISGGWINSFGIAFIPSAGRASVQVYRPNDFPAASAELFVQLTSLSRAD